ERLDGRERLAGIADKRLGMAALEGLADPPRGLGDAGGGIDIERRAVGAGEFHQIDAVHEQPAAPRLDIARDLPGAWRGVHAHRSSIVIDRPAAGWRRCAL